MTAFQGLLCTALLRRPTVWGCVELILKSTRFDVATDTASATDYVWFFELLAGVIDATAAEQAAVDETVQQAFLTYRVAQRLTERHKSGMRLTLLNDPASFQALYPEIGADKKYLLQHFSRDSTSLPSGTREVPSLAAMIDKAKRDKPELSHDDAFTLAYNERAALLGGVL